MNTLLLYLQAACFAVLLAANGCFGLPDITSFAVMLQTGHTAVTSIQLGSTKFESSLLVVNEMSAVDHIATPCFL